VTIKTTARPEPASHYDLVTDAWAYLLGDDLHYGYFDASDAPLSVATRALTKLMIGEAALAPRMSVLDVGCGTGNPALVLARQQDCFVLGISTSEVCVARANTRAADAGLSHRIQFEVRDGTNTSLDDSLFDRVWVMESSHLMARKDLLLKECARVLRPGGRLVLCDIILRRAVPFSEILKIQEDVHTLDRVFGRAQMATPQQYTEWAQAAGLDKVRTLDISGQTRPTFDRWRANAESNAGAVEKLIGPQGLADFRRACDVLSRFWLDWLGYGVVVADRTGGENPL